MIDFSKFTDWEEQIQTPAMKQTRCRRFKQDEIKIDVWKSGTIGMYTEGKQHFRYDVSEEDLLEILIDPNYFYKIK